MQGQSPGRTSAALILEGLVERFRGGDAGSLSWMYGQGSVIAGLTDDSDLDLVLVWDEEVPRASTMPGQSTITSHQRLALEQGSVDGYAVDLMHVPRDAFDDWMGQLEQGDGWADAAWPLPIYVAAGLAESELLLDRTGVGAEHRLRVQTPATPLVAKVRRRLDAAVPGFVKELRLAAERENRWLHMDLAVQLHKLIYTSWFLLEGHYPPFPKYLPQWYERFGMDREIRALEAKYWAAHDPAERTAVLESLAYAVLSLPSSADG